MKPEKIDIIPAFDGCFTVYDMDDRVEVVEQVIAWRIETYWSNDSCFSTSYPLTMDGEAGSNCIGIQNPDKTITVFEGDIYPSLEALNKERYPNK